MMRRRSSSGKKYVMITICFLPASSITAYTRVTMGRSAAFIAGLTENMEYKVRRWGVGYTHSRHSSPPPATNNTTNTVVQRCSSPHLSVNVLNSSSSGGQNLTPPPPLRTQNNNNS